MKTLLKIVAVLCLAVILSCNKKDNVQPVKYNGQAPGTPHGTTNTDNYASIKSFFAKNGVQAQVFNIDAATGGSFTSAKGTKVTIPANAFSYMGSAVTGNVKIEFKDIYDKSDMLLSDKATTMFGGEPLKSAGEFFIKATSNGNALDLNAALTITQPAKNGVVDQGMQGFILAQDTAKKGGWQQGWADSVGIDNVSADYVFTLYQFAQPTDSGTWCNSDNASYFSAYTQTVLTLNPTANIADSVSNVQVFLIFKGIDCMVHVYQGGSDFPYNYAPQGLDCTVVAVGINRKGKVFASFTPITIGANQTVNSTLTEITTDAFKTKLKALN